MNLSDQVISLPLAKRLKELGVVQQPWFFWVNLRDKNAETDFELCYAGDKRLAKIDIYEWYAAFTVAELGEMLPDDVRSQKTWSEEWKWRCERKVNEYVSASGADTEADARAKMLVYLIENKLVTV